MSSVIALAALVYTAGAAEPGDELSKRWRTVWASKDWVTVFHRLERMPGPVFAHTIVVRKGAHERVIQRVESRLPYYPFVIPPIISRDGTMVAILTTEPRPLDKNDRRIVRSLGSIRADGSGFRNWLTLVDRLPLTMPSGIFGTEMAWSHDNRKLVFLGHLPTTADRPHAVDPRQPSDRRVFAKPWPLVLLDLSTGDAKELIPAIGERIVDRDSPGSVITSQAWAPDNRRIVYMNDARHIVILDTLTGMEQTVGRGEEPTWSPDGQFIAFKKPREFGKHEGDYVIVSSNTPRKEALLLANPRPFWRSFWRPDYYLVNYYGAALWAPDGELLIVRRARGEGWDRYVLDRRTGQTEKLDEGVGESIGGRP